MNVFSAMMVTVNNPAARASPRRLQTFLLQQDLRKVEMLQNILFLMNGFTG
jgi:hypothetical protein